MEDRIFENRIDLSALNKAVIDISGEIRKIIVGQEEMVRLIITALLADGHVLIEGVPGVAKTLTAKLIAHAVNASFSRIQFTPDLMPSDVIGTPVFNPADAKFEFKKGPVFGNIVLVDEVNRAPAKTQAALLEVMEERQISIDGKTYTMDAPFMVLATQNPVEQEGTYRLPEAQLDRFLFKIEVPYPSEADELQILQKFNTIGNQKPLELIEPMLNGSQINDLRKQVKTIVIEEKLLAFIAKLINQTRNNKDIYLGASPRASLAIMNASKAMAAILGRDFVTPDDIIAVTLPVLRHRIILSPEKEMEGAGENDVIKQIINSLEIPR
ncbi:MAG: AAA family ATPase [Niabella sp.]